MAFCEDQYYERIGSIQQNIHERQKRRLELEKELFAYCRSDKRVFQIKCTKLRGYLKEICEREQQAKMRNRELLRDVELMEMSMKELYPDRNPLRQHKVECLNRISRFMATGQKIKTTALETDKGDVLHGPHQGESLPSQDRGLNRPSAVSMGPQTSRGPTTEDATRSVRLQRAGRHSPSHGSRASERSQRDVLRDSKVSREVVACSGARLSDDISGSDDSPGGSNLSDEHQRMAAMVPSFRALTVSACVPFGGDEQPPTLGVTLTRPKMNGPLASTNSRMCDRNSPAESTQDRGLSHQHCIKEEAGRVLQRSSPQTDLENKSEDVPEENESLSLSSSSVELSATSSGDDLSISLAEVPDKVVYVDFPTRRTDSPPGPLQRNATPEESISRHSQEPLDDSDSMNRQESSRESTSPEMPAQRLSVEGFLHLLDSIEERIHKGERSVYLVSSVGDGKLNKAISLCNARAGLNGEDLDACGAVVLHQLQRLSWSTSKGCLLTEEIVSANWSTSEPRKISSSVAPDAAPLWDRWFKHALFLKHHRVLTNDRLVQLFTPLLLPCNASYCAKAKVLLRTLLSQGSEECPTVESETPSSVLPSLLDDRTAETQPARPAEEQHTAGMQSCYETKAYQLLKQSATQQRPEEICDEEEDEELSGTNDVYEEDAGRVERSSHQDPYAWRENKQIQSYSAVQSKAFWGESDDSNSEIEAALRPKPYSTNNDDSDDFYD
uniref:Centrosomal protein kizuna n=1 Tax=Esox lucius TaxID=8010 RepID=A0A3P8XD23_ESOLU